MKKTFVSLDQLKKITEKYPTPFHLYDEKGIRENARRLYEAFSWNPGFKEYFAVKATPNPSLIRILKEEGCGVDCSSYTELMLSDAIGFSGEALGIASIVNTLTEFPSIQKVQLTVDGDPEKGMDWWGHVGLYEQPFTRDISMVYEPVIWVTEPVAQQQIKSPVIIKGTARVFEATVSYHLKDAEGNILGSGCTMASEGAPGRGEFEAELVFNPEQAGKGQLEVFEVSMKDGSEIHKIIIPVEWK
jgi:germination protein M